MPPTTHLLMLIQKNVIHQPANHYCCEAQYYKQDNIFSFTVRVSLTKFYSIEFDAEKDEWRLVNKKDNEDLFEKIVEKLQKVYDIL